MHLLPQSTMTRSSIEIRGCQADCKRWLAMIKTDTRLGQRLVFVCSLAALFLVAFFQATS